MADHGFRGPKLNHGQPQIPIAALPKPDVRQTANFEAVDDHVRVYGAVADLGQRLGDQSFV